MDVRSFYEKHIDLSNAVVSGDEIRALCPCHNDKATSFSINQYTGLYKCFRPGCKLSSGGSMVSFLSIIEQIPLAEARAQISKDNPKPKREKIKGKPFPISEEQIEQRAAGLLDHPERIQALTDITFWTPQTMNKYEIGYDAQEQRYWIPIRENGALVNIRKYSPAQDPKIIQITGHSTPRIFPYENLQEKELILMEGEKDCILANQHGFPAITFTGGAGVFKTEWKPYFMDRDLVICYDIDEAGGIGANKVAQNLIGVARSVRVVNLPITDPPNGDYTDYISQGYSPQDFRELIEETVEVRKESSGPIEIPDTVYETDLSRVTDEALFYKRTAMHVRVISKDTSPSIIPKCITVSCNKESGRVCYVCDLSNKNMNIDTMEINEDTPELLQLIECTTKERKSIIRDIFKIPMCKRFKIKETDHQAIIRCSVIPSIDEIKTDITTQNQKYVERDVFVLSYPIEANMDYEISAIAMPDPKNQSLVHLGYKVKPADSSIEEFKMTPELKKELEIFQCISETNSMKSMTTSALMLLVFTIGRIFI